jgi:hypothetical protein
MKITMGEYITRKYGSKVRALLAVEAAFFAVQYPLRNGWYEERCNEVFDADMLAQHLKNNLKRIKNQSTASSLRAGLRAIGCGDVEGSFVRNVSAKNAKREAKNAKREAKSKIQSKVMDFDSDGRIKAGTLINAYGVEMVVIPRFENGSVWAVDESGAITECELGEVVIL